MLSSTLKCDGSSTFEGIISSSEIDRTVVSNHYIQQYYFFKLEMRWLECLQKYIGYKTVSSSEVNETVKENQYI